MKKLILLLLAGMLSAAGFAQNYTNILNYNLNTTPVNGVKIKTNIPFQPGTQMPTITIQGYNYGTHEAIGLTLVFYIYSDPNDFYNPSKYYFYYPTITSFGSYTPPVILANESGNVVIYINDRSYYQRFTVSAFAQGVYETSAQYQGWTTADEVLTGTQQSLIPYQSRLAGNAYLPGNGIWSSNGNVGIGTITPQEALSVNGNIRSRQVKVETANWPDYVFKPTYHLPALTEVKTYLVQNQHLPELPSAQELAKDGLDLGEMNKLLAKKIEELTLYLIEQKAQTDKLQQQVDILTSNKN